MKKNIITNITTERSFTREHSNNYRGRFSFYAKIIPALIQKPCRRNFRQKKANIDTYFTVLQ